MKKFNLVLVLVLALSLSLVACNNNAPATMDETDQNKMQSIPADNADSIIKTDSADAPAADAMTVKLSAEDAVKIFNDKYAGVSIDEISFQMEEGSYVYEINGFDDEKEYNMAIDAADGSIIMDESENDRNDGDKAIDLNLLGNVNELIDDAKSKAGEGYYLDSYSVDVDDRGNITKLDIELKDEKGKDIEYEYNLETKELIKKDM